MVLPAFNGPTEGLLMLAASFLISFYYGADWWTTKELFLAPSFITDTLPVVPRVIQPIHLFLGFLISMIVCTISMQTVTSIKCSMKKGLGFSHPLKTVLPFVVFCGSGIFWTLQSEIAVQKYYLLIEEYNFALYFFIFV